MSTFYRMSLAVVLAALGSSLCGGCSRRPDAGTTQTTSATQEQPRATPTLSNEDQTFMRKAAQGGVAEVTLGRLAVERAGSPDVKAFGQRMIADHQKAGDELSQLAAKRAVVLPTEVNQDQQKDVAKLLKLDRTKFDVAYADDMVDDHKEDVKDFREASKGLQDPEFRDWAAKTLPVLEDHLAKAKELKAHHHR
jgi:putative membrane protein